MFTIIHGSHKHGIHWEIVQLLKEKLDAKKIDTRLVDLTNLEFNMCCGDQICQEANCVFYDDELFRIFQSAILPADGIYIVTPTYFNMPPAKLKNFIDRTNALLPELENREKETIFGTWVSGEADIDSITCHANLLNDYAEIMGWTVVGNICNKVLIDENYKFDENTIIEISERILSLL